MTCPVCGSGNLAEWYPADVESAADVSFSYTFSPEHRKTFRVVRCLECSHAFCWPIPENIVGQYVGVVDCEYLRHSRSRQLAAEAVLAIIASYRRTGVLLDIGCATGDFLAAARSHGYVVEGLELSRWSSQIARRRGFVVHEEHLETLARRQPGRYDVVTLWGVIEHFSRPATEMRHVVELLKPGGLVAIWTGDVRSVTSRFLGRRWWYWQGQHIQYFSHASLKRLAESTGLQHLTTKLYPFGMTWETLSNSLRRYRFHSIASALLRPLFAVKPVWHLRLPGEMLFIACRPRSGGPAAGAEP